ncbi:transposase [Janibacter sp. Soil728]|uniref:3-keto-5-aminohexanoate cleavage protein n=1 Tax=Janibacter sp. Soil728 TaxID=1736393 RepID=UPI0006FBD4C4|nr:3-keto-5-aminohexanoate cleavage protein [Janibacter sp. Soil728]KRE35718.1 transposase [Janibacter sp. Soil728]
MHFVDDALFPELQDKMVITAAPYGPEWEPDDFPGDIAVTMEEQIRKGVDCFNAGATVLHIHCRELDGKGSKRMSQFNELLAGLRAAVPEMILQVGGSISFAPEGDGADAKWLSDDTRHMLAELDPKPDQVTIAINTNQMNIMELMTESDIEGTSMQRPELAETYRNMTVPANPEWVAEHLKRLRASGIQPHFQLANVAQLETVDRLVRRGTYLGPLNITWVAIGGGFDGPSPYNMMEFIRRVPDGASLTLESIQRNVLPINAMATAMGLHTRCGNEDTLWGRKGEHATSVQQIEQIVRLCTELGREVATAEEAREIYQIGTWFDDVDETLHHLGLPPNRRPGQRGFLMHGRPVSEPTDAPLPTLEPALA